MELIKLSDNKTKIILDSDELALYGVCRDRRKNLKAVEKIFSYLKNSSGIDLFSPSVSVKIKLCTEGECEIILEKIEREFEMRTFVFDKAELEKLFSALKNCDFRKNSALYKYKEVYILELFSPKNSPLPCRIADFGREISLLSRRDFLSGICTRVNFP